MTSKQTTRLRHCVAVSICFLTVMALNVASQKTSPRTIVTVTMTDDGPRSELPFIPIGGPPGVTAAQFSAMYFGPQRDSDISFLLLAKFQRPRYSGKRTFAIKFLIDETPLSHNLRMVNRVKTDEGGESLQFSITTDEIAWLALGERLEIVVYDADSKQKLDTYRFTAGGMRELKSFAKTVLIIQNTSN